MKKLLLGACMAASLISAYAATPFEESFQDSTLRVDYIFGGDPSRVNIMMHSQSKTAGWAGRRSRLKEMPLAGNGSVMVLDPENGDTLYHNTFSSLFQEWLPNPMSREAARSFENSFQVPLPKRAADIVVALRDNRHQEIARFTHRYRTDDELVRKEGATPLPYKYIHQGGKPEEAIDVAVLAEGYREEEMDSFLNAAKRITDEILSYEPYASHKDKFNFVAVMSPSRESGVSVPLKGEWRDTAFSSHYSTFYSSRYLTTPDVWRVHEALAGVPYEHILILVNTDEYGGGGIYNSYQIAAANNRLTLPVAVHEFGHSFGGLADEYFYTEEEDGTYPLDVEPWEPNITTLVDFDSKWKEMLADGTSVPTPCSETVGTREEQMKRAEDGLADGKSGRLGVYEGGGYRAKGIYRPQITCRMRDNYHPAFCPVCEAALTRLIHFYTNIL